MKEVIKFLTIAVMYFLIFAYDIEYHRDVYTWLWLLNSIIFILFGAISYTNYKKKLNKI